jgi:hypothetical protein
LLYAARACTSASCYSLELTKVLLQKPLQNSCTTHQGNAKVYCHSSLIIYIGVDQIFYQLLNQLAIVFFSLTHMRKQIQAPRLIVYL